MTNQDMLIEATDFVQDMLGMGVKNPFLINEKTGKQSRDRHLMEARHLIRYYLKSTYRLSWSRLYGLISLWRICLLTIRDLNFTLTLLEKEELDTAYL